MIEETRIKSLNENHPAKGEYIGYWMQASQRAEYNHALEFAIKQANQNKLPLIVYFGLTDNFPESNERHYYFMLEGLKELRGKLYSRGIGMVIERASPESGVINFAQKARLMVCDRGYLKIQKYWRRYVAENIKCPLTQVESDVVVPVETATYKEEYSAATLRRKLQKIIHSYLVPIEAETPLIDSSRMQMAYYDISDIDQAISQMEIDHSVQPVTGFHGGESEAQKRLDEFIAQKLYRYEDLRNDPNANYVSNLSPYLHFGQISPLKVALEVSRNSGKSTDAFLEELIIRRELSMNFVRYNPYYDSYQCLPEWVKKT